MDAERVEGMDEVLRNMKIAGDLILQQVAEAVEKTAVDVANHAKAGHEGNKAHMNERYQNQTTNLTNSITPEMGIVTPLEVEAIVYTTMEYAYYVECLYPYLWPALVANEGNLRRRVNEALHR